MFTVSKLEIKNGTIQVEHPIFQLSEYDSNKIENRNHRGGKGLANVDYFALANGPIMKN